MRSLRSADHPLRRLLGVLVLACALGLAGPARGEATIAIIGPWTANLSYAAIGSLRGFELGLDAINAAGGVLGQRLRAVRIDDGCNPAQQEVAARIAIANHPVAVMGGACAPGAVANARLFADAGILQLIPNVPQEELGDAGFGTVFRMTGRSDREGTFTAAMIARLWPGRRIALADDGEPHWQEAADAAAAGLAQRGIGAVLRLYFAPNRPSYADFIETLKGDRIELLYLNGLPPDMGVIVREAAAAQLGAEILVSRNGRLDVFRQTAGPALEGVYFVDKRDWLQDALADPVLAGEKARGGDINVFVVSAYSAIKVWGEATAAAGTFASAEVAAVLKGRSFMTPLGPLAFDAKGDLTEESEQWALHRWHGGAAERAD